MIVDLWHRDLHVALRHYGPVRSGHPIRASNVILLDGTTPQHGTIAVCGTCGQQIPISDLRRAPVDA